MLSGGRAGARRDGAGRLQGEHPVEDDGHFGPGQGALGVEAAVVVALDDAGLGQGGHGILGVGGGAAAVGEAVEVGGRSGGDAAAGAAEGAVEEDHGVLAGEGRGGVEAPVVGALGDAQGLGHGDGLGVVAVGGHVLEAVGGVGAEVEGPVEHQHEVAPGDIEGGTVGGGAGAGGDTAVIEEVHRGGGPAVAAHVGKTGGLGGGGDGDVHPAGEAVVLAVGTGVGDGDGAVVGGLGDEGDGGDGAAAGGGGEGDGGAHQAAVFGGVGVAVVELAGGGGGQLELHGGEGARAPGGAGVDKVKGGEGHRGGGGGVADDGGLLGGGIGDDHGAGDAVAVGAPAGEGNLHVAGLALLGDKGHVVQPGAGGAVVGGAAGDLLLAALVVLVVEGAPGGAGQGEADIVQTVLGEVLAVVVEIAVVKGDGGARGGGVGDVALVGVAHPDLQRAGEAVAVGAHTGEGDGDGAVVVGGGYEGHVVQLGGRGAVVLVGGGDLLLIAALAVAVVKGALGGGGGRELHIVHVVARLVLAVVVEIGVVQGDGLVLLHRVGDDGAALAHGDLHGAGEAVPGVAAAGVGDGEGAGVILGGDKGDVAQIGGVVVVALGGGGELVLVLSAVVQVQGTPGGADGAEGHVVQGGAGDLFADAVEVAVGKGEGLVLSGLVGDVAGGGGEPDLEGAVVGLAGGVPAGVGKGGGVAAVAVGDEGDLGDGLAGAAGVGVGGGGGDLGAAGAGGVVEVKGALGGILIELHIVQAVAVHPGAHVVEVAAVQGQGLVHRHGVGDGGHAALGDGNGAVQGGHGGGAALHGGGDGGGALPLAGDGAAADGGHGGLAGGPGHGGPGGQVVHGEGAALAHVQGEGGTAEGGSHGLGGDLHGAGGGVFPAVHGDLGGDDGVAGGLGGDLSAAVHGGHGVLVGGPGDGLLFRDGGRGQSAGVTHSEGEAGGTHQHAAGGGGGGVVGYRDLDGFGDIAAVLRGYGDGGGAALLGGHGPGAVTVTAAQSDRVAVDRPCHGLVGGIVRFHGDRNIGGLVIGEVQGPGGGGEVDVRYRLFDRGIVFHGNDTGILDAFGGFLGLAVRIRLNRFLNGIFCGDVQCRCGIVHCVGIHFDFQFSLCIDGRSHTVRISANIPALRFGACELKIHALRVTSSYRYTFCKSRNGDALRRPGGGQHGEDHGQGQKRREKAGA